MNSITSKLDFLTIENEGTQEKHFDVDSNSLILMGYNNKLMHNKNSDDITSDNQPMNNSNENNHSEVQVEEINEEEHTNDENDEEIQNNEQPEINTDDKSSDSHLFNFKSIDLENHDDTNKFNIELGNDVEKMTNDFNLEVEENNFFPENNENVQPEISNEEHDDKSNDDNVSNNDEHTNETNDEISVDYTNLKKYFKTHKLSDAKVSEMKALIVDCKIDMIEPSILTLKKNELFNRLKDFVKGK